MCFPIFHWQVKSLVVVLKKVRIRLIMFGEVVCFKHSSVLTHIAYKSSAKWHQMTCMNFYLDIVMFTDATITVINWVLVLHDKVYK